MSFPASTMAAFSQTEKLIGLVRERSFLYDIKDVRYKLRSKRVNAWKEITREMGSGNVNVWTAKWKGLKDNYGKHKKAIPPHSDITYKKYKHWPWAEHMRFLDKYSSVRVRNMKCTHVQNDSKETTQQIAQLYLPDPNDANSSLHPNEQDTDMLDDKTKFQMINDSTEVPETSQRKRTDDKEKLDGVDHFFLSYAQSFKQLPSRMQIMLKLEIATLFSRYELQADGVTRESLDNIPRVVPKYEFTYTVAE
uniref:MADF domain-containing protein n=1 Tax=Heliothis virescens TaxID=7102 RepID=A0A2A4JPR3_HELVI